MNVVFKNQNTETISLFKSDFSRSINGLQKIRVKKWGMSWSLYPSRMTAETAAQTFLPTASWKALTFSSVSVPVGER